MRRRVADEGVDADDESEIISVGGPLSIVGGCESEGVTFEEAVGRARIVSETDTALDTAGLRICKFSNFSITINFLLGFHKGQLFHPLSYFSCAHNWAELDFAIGLWFSVQFCRRTCQTVSSWQWWTVCFRQRIWSWRSNFRRRFSSEGFPESSVGGCGWELILISPNYLRRFPAFMYNCVLCFRHWRGDRRRWSRVGVHWRGERDRGAQEKGCCYQKTGTARWGTQHCLLAADSSQTRNRQLLEKAFEEGIHCFKWVIF